MLDLDKIVMTKLKSQGSAQQKSVLSDLLYKNLNAQLQCAVGIN